MSNTKLYHSRLYQLKYSIPVYFSLFKVSSFFLVLGCHVILILNPYVHWYCPSTSCLYRTHICGNPEIILELFSSKKL